MCWLGRAPHRRVKGAKPTPEAQERSTGARRRLRSAVHQKRLLRTLSQPARSDAAHRALRESFTATGSVRAHTDRASLRLSAKGSLLVRERTSTAPAIALALTACQRAWADVMSLDTMPRAAAWLPATLVTLVRNLTVSPVSRRGMDEITVPFLRWCVGGAMQCENHGPPNAVSRVGRCYGPVSNRLRESIRLNVGAPSARVNTRRYPLCDPPRIDLGVPAELEIIGSSDRGVASWRGRSRSPSILAPSSAARYGDANRFDRLTRRAVEHRLRRMRETR